IHNAGEGLSDRAPSALQPLSCIAGEGAERSEAGEGYGEGREEAEALASDRPEEQRLLRESLDRLLGDRSAFEQRKSYGQVPEGWSRALWAQYAELGLLGLPFAEQYGGSGGGPRRAVDAEGGFRPGF